MKEAWLDSQARNEVRKIIRDLPDKRLWDRPAGAASAGFHLQHLSGVLDRLFTYARGEPLDASQLAALESEGSPDGSGTTTLNLYNAFERQVESAIGQLRATREATLRDSRKVGRAGLPSTVQGLLFHAAEHAQRHVGQLLVTVKVLGVAAETKSQSASIP